MTTPTPIVREATDKLHEVEQKIQEFFDKVNDVLSWVPGFLTHLIEPIKAGMDNLRQKVKDFRDRVNQFINEPGNSDRLNQVANQWSNEVGNAIGDVAGTVTLDKLQTNIDWSGRGAEAYKATVPAQGSGLGSVKDLANQLHSSLSNLATGIDNFWLALKIAFITFAVGAAGAIVAACTVVGTPAAIAAILGAAGISIGLITAAILAVNSFMDTIKTEQDTIKQKAHDVGSKWSKSNIGAMDNRSDWQLGT